MLYYLAAAIRAHDAVFRARGVDARSYVVPLPVNMRPKGGEGALFRTHVSMLWFHVPAEIARDFDALLEALKAQRRDSIKAGLVEAGIAAMDYARFAPCAALRSHGAAHVRRRALLVLLRVDRPLPARHDELPRRADRERVPRAVGAGLAGKRRGPLDRARDVST